MVDRRLAMAGWLLFGSVLTALASGLFHLSPLPTGILQLTAAALLFNRAAAMIRLQTVLLAATGALALLWARADSSTALAALSTNQAIISMLGAVGFLRLVPLPASAGSLPTGPRALWQTMFGVHWLGSVTNVSAVVLFGDRMASPASRLDANQGVVLVRGFALAALWSPFFVAMGVAVNQVPGARIAPVLLWGLGISQFLMAVTAWRLGRSLPPGAFAGYPFTPATMTGPMLLGGGVLAAHFLAPGVSILTLVTFAAPLYALIACRRLGPLDRAAEYIRRDLPRMGSEVLLFQAAGVLGTGFTALVNQRTLSLPVGGGGVLITALGLAIIIAVAAIGIHPIIGIAAVGSVLGQIGIRPELLVLSYLMGWGLGVMISPISGTNLLLAGRYGFTLGQLWRWNVGFVAGAYLVCCAWLGAFTFLG